MSDTIFDNCRLPRSQRSGLAALAFFVEDRANAVMTPGWCAVCLLNRAPPRIMGSAR